MKALEELSKEELIELIRLMKGTSDDHVLPLKQFDQELSVHGNELELQNQELRDTADKLEHSRNRYASLYDFVPVGYLSFDEHGTILEANLTMAKLLGVERSELIGLSFPSFLDVSCHSKFLQHIH